MALKISESLRSEVIQAWLRPLSRNKVAALCGISPASASGIIDDWKRSVGVTRAQQVLDLVTGMDRYGISLMQCVEGYRVARLLSTMGADKDKTVTFLEDAYSKCVEIGITPQDIASHIQDLVSFAVGCQNLRVGMEEKSEVDEGGDISHPPQTPTMLQIAKHAKMIKEENKKSELKNKKLKDETALLEAKKSSAMQQTAEMLNKNRMTAEKLDWYLEMKTHLLVSGHAENDFELLMKGIKLVKEEGYDFLAIAAQFSEHEKLLSSIRRLQVQNSLLERNADRLEEKAEMSEQIIESKSQLQWNMVKLEGMRFGLKQLSRLYNIVKEIS